MRTGRWPTWSFAPVIVALLLAACSSGGSQPMPRILQADAARDVVDGEALPATTVTVQFDREFRLVSDRLPLASYFEFEVPLLDGSATTRVLVQEASIDGADARRVILKVRGLIPEGSTLAVARKAFRPAAEGNLEVDVDSDLAPVQAFFATVAFTFTSGDVVPEPPAVPAVVPADRDVSAQRAALGAHLASRGAPAEVQAQALARFDAVPAAIVPSPKLRAALAALTGTFADAAPGSLITTDNCTGAPAALVAFQEPPERPDLLARVTNDRQGHRIVSLHPRLEGERIEHLMVLLAHEAIHCDDDDGRFEEIAATALDTLLYSQLLTVFPELARAGTVLARDFNVDALAMLNSGRRYPESAGVLASAGLGQVLPGSSAPYRSFAEVVAAAYPEVTFNQSAPEPLAVAYAAEVAAAVGADAGDPFDLAYLDELIARAFTADLIAALLDGLALAPA